MRLRLVAPALLVLAGCSTDVARCQKDADCPSTALCSLPYGLCVAKGSSAGSGGAQSSGSAGTSAGSGSVTSSTGSSTGTSGTGGTTAGSTSGSTAGSSNGSTSGSTGGCVFDGGAYPSGPVDGNPCVLCEPAVSASHPVLVEGPANGCAANTYCHAGSCQSGCFANNTFYAPGTGTDCTVCMPDGGAPGALANRADGSDCSSDGGKVCVGGACQFECWICTQGGCAAYGPGQVPPDDQQTTVCATCQPSLNAHDISTVANDTACGTAAFSSGYCYQASCCSMLDGGGTCCADPLCSPN